MEEVNALAVPDSVRLPLFYPPLDSKFSFTASCQMPQLNQRKLAVIQVNQRKLAVDIFK